MCVSKLLGQMSKGDADDVVAMIVCENLSLSRCSILVLSLSLSGFSSRIKLSLSSVTYPVYSRVRFAKLSAVNTPEYANTTGKVALLTQLPYNI